MTKTKSLIILSDCTARRFFLFIWFCHSGRQVVLRARPMYFQFFWPQQFRVSEPEKWRFFGRNHVAISACPFHPSPWTSDDEENCNPVSVRAIKCHVDAGGLVSLLDLPFWPLLDGQIADGVSVGQTIR